MSQGLGCHLVGSVACNSNTEVFESVGQILKGKIKVFLICERILSFVIENT